MLLANRWIRIVVVVGLAIILLASLFHDDIPPPEHVLNQILDHIPDRFTSSKSQGAHAHGNTVETRPVVDKVDHDVESYIPPGNTHHILYSNSTRDGKYFSIDFGGDEAYNGNILAHPNEPGKWLVAAQRNKYDDEMSTSAEVICTARMLGGVMHCPDWPSSLPVAASITGHCDPEWGYTNMRHGPRDARVFYSPDAPYIIYGSQSEVVCLGLWLQDLRLLLDGGKHPNASTWYRGATEIKRPGTPHQMEKNYFLFWDSEGRPYAHYDLYPHRSFAQLRVDGTPTTAWLDPTWLDLALPVAAHDDACMENYMPTLPADASIHQATNALLLTLCARSDPSCTPTDDNTYILHIFQIKTYVESHGIYEPYPVLFASRPPFEIHAIGLKPLWIHGREILTEKTESRFYTTNEIYEDAVMPENQTELFYVTSINWKSPDRDLGPGKRGLWHGYIDDVIMLGFGIEDTRSAGIDVVAGELVAELGVCRKLGSPFTGG